MADLSRYVHYACGLVNFDIKTIDDKEELMNKFLLFCDSYNKIINYYLICHDETDVIHIHFVFYSISQVQLATYFNKMRDWFVYKHKLTRDEYGIQIEKCESINAHLRYFLHQDKDSIASNKKQYELSDIISNVDEDVIDTLIHSKKGQIDAYYLRDAVLDCHDDFELMIRLGLAVYHRYYREIETLRGMRSVLILQREEERKERIKEDLPF